MPIPRTYSRLISRLVPAALCAAALAAPAFALTLHEAQESLFRSNPDLAIQQLEVERAQVQVREAKAAWSPSLDAVGNYAYTTERSHLQLDLPFPPPGGTHIDRPLGDNDKAEVGVDASWALFTGFARGRNVESRKAGLRAREAQWRGARNLMSLRLAALYHAWQLAGSQAAFQEKLLVHARELERQLGDFVKAGTAVRSRALGAQAKAKAVEVDLLAAQNTRDSLAYEVIALLGADGTNESPTLVADTSLPAEPDWNIPGSQGARPDAEALEEGANQARLAAKALAGQRLPQVYGMAGLRYANPGVNLAGEDEFMGYGIAGLQLKWNLWDGARNRSQRGQLDVQARVLAEQKRKLEGDWRKSMSTARLQYARWAAQYSAAQASREAAQAASADLKKQLDAGVATAADWLEARNSEARAELAMEQARTMQRLARLQWEYAAGKEMKF